MRFPRNHKIFKGQLDPASYVGVFFILLVILLFHSDLVNKTGVEINLPVGTGLVAGTNETLVVALVDNGDIYFDNQKLGSLFLDDSGTVNKALVSDLKVRIQKEAQDLEGQWNMDIQADKSQPIEALIELREVARELGAGRVFLQMKPSDFPGMVQPRSQ
ncbi:MAG TPA: hypothetical protein EYQ50_05380 [Verrucomicrobiales bacterium]|jgi:biopolymer transport protein ExbD|nr:hypothetical protein [Verrucomicrobiales bacterium]HIL72461.1 hypothetical protein [Verrucomicrobiota bacterium]